jgi:4-hydroxybenzoyl-CoA reductase subunit beta
MDGGLSTPPTARWSWAPASRWPRWPPTPILAQRLPALADAAQAAAGPGHRSAATLGGNLCQDTRCMFYNQSAWWRQANDYCLKRGGDTCHVAPQGARCHAAFCSDLAPVLLALGSRGRRCCPRAGIRWPARWPICTATTAPPI